MNELITPIYLLDNKLAAHLLTVLTGEPNSIELTPSETDELNDVLIHDHGYKQLLKTFSIQSTLDINFIERYQDDFDFDLINLLRTNNKTKVYDLIILLNNDDQVSFDYARYKSDLYTPKELAISAIPLYEKLTEHKSITLLNESVRNAEQLRKHNKPNLDDLIPENLFQTAIQPEE